MGRLQAQEMADHLELRQAMAWHLRCNHFPPIPETMVDPCLEAIDNANAGEWDRLISLPEGVGYKGLTVAPTDAIIEQHHLHTFLDYEDE